MKRTSHMIERLLTRFLFSVHLTLNSQTASWIRELYQKIKTQKCWGQFIANSLGTTGY
jgi:hypothetical protein